MTKVLILIESLTPPSLRVDKTGITFDHCNDPSLEEDVVTFFPLDESNETYGPEGKTGFYSKSGGCLDTYG